MKTILITGGAGFIGTNLIRFALDRRPDWRIVNLDALTYAGNLAGLADIQNRLPERYRFVQGNISDEVLINRLFEEEGFSGVFHLAAESHVDRSIHDPLAFVETNVMGTGKLIEVCHQKWNESGKNPEFRFIHVSTDEVYGSLGNKGKFTADTPYAPSSPYSASKAGADHIVKAWFKTFDFPAIVTNCSNNFGPFQFPEKLIPLMITRILEKKELPVYGKGDNIRDWIYVIDHCDALIRVYERGIPGDTYLIGGGNEYGNLDLVCRLCDLVDSLTGNPTGNPSKNLIRFVTDRPGHDYRYAVDISGIRNILDWTPRYDMDQALGETINWYLSHQDWVENIATGEYRQWITTNYNNRR